MPMTCSVQNVCLVREVFSTVIKIDQNFEKKITHVSNSASTMPWWIISCNLGRKHSGLYIDSLGTLILLVVFSMF